jgi:hypothetical protein
MHRFVIYGNGITYASRCNARKWGPLCMEPVIYGKRHLCIASQSKRKRHSIGGELVIYSKKRVSVAPQSKGNRPLMRRSRHLWRKRHLCVGPQPRERRHVCAEPVIYGQTSSMRRAQPRERRHLCAELVIYGKNVIYASGHLCAEPVIYGKKRLCVSPQSKRNASSMHRARHLCTGVMYGPKGHLCSPTSWINRRLSPAANKLLSRQIYCSLSRRSGVGRIC